MIVKKIYVAGLNMSGKGLLTQLLDGHSKIAVFPYHKFGISCVYDSFKKFTMDKKHFYEQLHFETDNKTIIKIKFEDTVYTLTFSELIFFLIKNNKSIIYLIQSNYSKKCLAFAGDKNFVKHEFNFDLFKFIQTLELYIKSNNEKEIDCELLDNFIFNAFIKSTDEYNKIYNQISHYAQWTLNKSEDIINIFNYYQNFKCIYVQRDILSASYSIAIRSSRKYSDRLNKKFITKLIFEAAHQRIKKENLFFDKLKNFIKNKEKLKIIQFDDLFSNRENIMKNLSKFLELDYDDKLLKPHLINKIITNSNFNKKNMNDDPNDLFSVQEINKLNKIIYSKYRLLIYRYIYKFIFFYIFISSND